MTEATTIKLMVEVEIEIDADDWKDWMDMVTGGKEGYGDLFSTDHCGYWLRGLAHVPGAGWLAMEMNGDESDVQRERTFSADWFKRWVEHVKNGRLPHVNKIGDGVFFLDESVARKAWAEGVKRHGMDWYVSGDANTIDAVVQIALLGEIRYG